LPKTTEDIDEEIETLQLELADVKKKILQSDLDIDEIEIDIGDIQTDVDNLKLEEETEEIKQLITKKITAIRRS